MNTSSRLVPAFLTLLTVTGQAAVVIVDSGPLNELIPDNSSITRTLEITAPDNEVITDVEVRLNLSGGMAGDLYAYLVHDSGFSVLLNRPGRTESTLDGYDDPANFTITLHDGAAGDIHSYRADPNIPLEGPLTGTWQPDGREVLPAADWDWNNLDRTAMLSSFKGLSGTGVWTLHFRDVASMDQATLHSWGLTLTYAPVPEPTAMMGAMGALLFGWGLWRQGRRQ